MVEQGPNLGPSYSRACVFNYCAIWINVGENRLMRSKSSKAYLV